MTDIKKDGLFGNVRSIETYAYKEISIDIWDPGDLYPSKPDKNGWKEIIFIKPGRSISTDTIFEILLSKTIYNQKGNRVEKNEYQSDNVLATWPYLPQDYIPDGKSFRSQPQKIDKKLYKHFKYNYNKDNVIESILSLNLDGSFKFRTEIHFSPIRRKIIDSTFYENRGLNWTTKYRLTKYGISEPEWIYHRSDHQFDNNNQIIIEGEIHYYYDKYDEHGNWIKLTKYYKGQTKENPVYLKRIIEYF